MRTGQMKNAEGRHCGFMAGLILIWVISLNASAHSQCTNQITLVPFRAFTASSKPRDFTRFKYSLSNSDSLLIRAHEDPETSLGPYDTGLVIKRNGSLLQRISIRQVPEIRREDADYANSFTTLAVTRACGGDAPTFFVTMQYQGDMTSPALLFVLIRANGRYLVSIPPMISGGVFEVSRTDPLHLRTWDNLHEGNCEACETAYEITDYLIRNGKLVAMGKHRTRRFYTSGEFDDRRRIRFAR